MMMRNTILKGHVLEKLREIPDGIVQCVITSPPYYQTRVYKGNQEAIWGGDPQCQHKFENSECIHCKAYLSVLGQEDLHDCLSWARGEEPCNRCYVCHIRSVMKELKRVLKKDGIIWLNVGDSYINKLHSRYKKNLYLIPQRLALALQYDGFYIRSWVTWAKRVYLERYRHEIGNGMPESIMDRPTDSSEIILMITISPNYYYDWMGFAPPIRWLDVWGKGKYSSNNWKYKENNPRKNWGFPKEVITEEIYQKLQDIQPLKRIGNVWQIYTRQHSYSHLAIMPPLLAEICIKLSTSEKGECPKCGKNWIRIIEKGIDDPDFSELDTKFIHVSKGFKPQCECGCDPIPNIVLDPFAGSGTTLEVAKSLGRDFIGIEISDEYVKICEERIFSFGSSLFSPR